ncbi:Tetratricopeptide repeat protein [Caulifigura coniformis]|uniref:Tetratricopeptide repeat protein n=1 Tax=Caulifigura coniformis TaxID=2527983 RepID=A0A517S7I0_9PLAN|nr:hypothetical protein [Caulifigura coniformis]QDT52091.1 Tetratricopeptide repeat protein [Caulifigura coniformis]
MLARRLLVAAALTLAASSSASAQIVGHSPGPRTRFEWNTNRPYSGGWNYSGGRGGGISIGIGVGVPFGYNYYAPYAAYGGPVIVPPYGYGYGYSAFPPSTAGYGYVPGPVFTAPFPPQIIPPPNPLDPVDELEARFNERNREQPIPLADRLPVLKPSTPEQQQRSLRHMATADQQFKMGHYAGAALEYRRAIADAEDLPDNYFGLGICLAAQRRYSDAVQQWKYGLTLDPTWPSRGESLAALFGEANQFEKQSLLNRVSEYVRLDPRDPERIFLLGVLVHFDGDRTNARTLFESATRVAGNEPWLTAFLSADSNQNIANVPGNAAPAPGTVPPGKSVPPAVDPNAGGSTIPAPPPANVNRSRTNAPSNSLPPASLNPQDAQPIPRRQDASPPPADDTGPPEKFPALQAPKPPTDI